MFQHAGAVVHSAVYTPRQSDVLITFTGPRRHRWPGSPEATCRRSGHWRRDGLVVDVYTTRRASSTWSML